MRCPTRVSSSRHTRFEISTLRRSLAAVACLVGLAAAPGFAETGAEGDLGLLDAVLLALEHDPNVALATSQVTSAKASLLAAQGVFDPVFSVDASQQDARSPSLSGDSSESRSLSLGAGLSQRFRSGLLIQPAIDVTRDDAPGAAAVNEGTVSISVRMPLLRDRGRQVVGAGVLRAEREALASGRDRQQTIASRVLAVASRYWSYVSAALNLEILLASERSSETLLETTIRLVEADVSPAAELVLLRANVASKQSSRIRGERDLFEARQNLGREIGLTPAAVRALSAPEDDFPHIEPELVPNDADEAFIDLALRLRHDLRATRQRLESAAILARAAANGIKPRLDVFVTPSYQGLSGGDDVGRFFSGLFDHVPGLSTLVGMSLSWPTRNRSAEGELSQALESEVQRRLQVERLEKQIGADVPTALETVRSTVEQLERAQLAVELFAQALVNEEKKLQVGTSTLLDVISQQDRLTSAQQGLVSARSRLASALLDLRFQTGSLVRWTGDDATVRLADLTTIPAVDAVGESDEDLP